MLVTKDGSVSGTRSWSKPGKEPIVHPFSGAFAK